MWFMYFPRLLFILVFQEKSYDPVKVLDFSERPSSVDLWVYVYVKFNPKVKPVVAAFYAELKR